MELAAQEEMATKGKGLATELKLGTYTILQRFSHASLDLVRDPLLLVALIYRSLN